MSTSGLAAGAAAAAVSVPAFCRGLLDALDASDGRRRRRKRNTTPDAIGLEIKRELLQAALAEEPDPGQFEEWLFGRVLAAGELGEGAGAVQAMALSILDDWRLAAAAHDFRAWLADGARSDDRARGSAGECTVNGCAPTEEKGR
ncbi:MAG TPA: hypothetical protein VF832_16840 [Longimicrobiales bacterium]